MTMPKMNCDLIKKDIKQKHQVGEKMDRAREKKNNVFFSGLQKHFAQ